MTPLQQVREGLEQSIPATFEASDDDDVFLVGYVVVAEWAGTEGRRWLTRTSGDLNDTEPPAWTVKGWLCDSLDSTNEEDE